MKKLFVAAICAMGLGTGAYAVPVSATFDFVALAVGNEGVVEGDSFMDSGLTVTVTSTNNAYLDDLSGGNPGGLGVCQTLSCAGVNDDNVNSGEGLTLTFDFFLTEITSVSFNDANHISLDTSSMTYLESTNLLAPISLPFSTALIPLALAPGTFQYGAAYGGDDPTDFYISSITVVYDDEDPTGGAIPLPAGMSLLLGALGVLGLARRRKAA